LATLSGGAQKRPRYSAQSPAQRRIIKQALINRIAHGAIHRWHQLIWNVFRVQIFERVSNGLYNDDVAMKVPISTQAVPNMKGAQIFRRSAWEGGRGYRESTASLINQYPSTSYRQGALRDDGLLVEDFQMRVQSHARVCQQLSEGHDS
jgi:hypothetical protein